MWVRSLTWATLRPARWRASARTSPIATTYPHCSTTPRTIPDNAARRPDSPLPDTRCATVIHADVALPAIVAADDQHPVPSSRARVSHRRQHHALVAETGDLTHTVHHRDAHADHLPRVPGLAGLPGLTVPTGTRRHGPTRVPGCPILGSGMGAEAFRQARSDAVYEADQRSLTCVDAPKQGRIASRGARVFGLSFGASQAGKTTLIRVLLGLTRAEGIPGHPPGRPRRLRAGEAVSPRPAGQGPPAPGARTAGD